MEVQRNLNIMLSWKTGRLYVTAGHCIAVCLWVDLSHCLCSSYTELFTSCKDLFREKWLKPDLDDKQNLSPDLSVTSISTQSMPGKAALSWFSLHTGVNIINHPELNWVQLYLIMGATAPVGMNATQVWVFLSLHKEMKAGVTLPPSVWNQMFFRVTLCKIWSWQSFFLFQTLFHTITISCLMDLVLVSLLLSVQERCLRILTWVCT